MVNGNVGMSGRTFDPNSKKKASSTPQSALTAGQRFFVKDSHACKTLRNSIEHAESTVIKAHWVSPDITPLICFGNRMSKGPLLGVNTAR